MKILIEIDCEDDQEALTHLSVIRATLKKKFTKDPEGRLINFNFSDSNCYGDHEVKITERE